MSPFEYVYLALKCHSVLRTLSVLSRLAPHTVLHDLVSTSYFEMPYDTKKFISNLVKVIHCDMVFS